MADGFSFVNSMHMSQPGRIDGLTSLYKKHNVKEGDIAELFLTDNELTINFINSGLVTDQTNKPSEERASKVSTELGRNQELTLAHPDLKQSLDRVKELIDRMAFMFYNNESNVRSEIIEPILRALGWGWPNVEREGTCSNGGRVDYALYDDKRCMAIIEVKSIDKNINEEKYLIQLKKYLNDERFKNVQYGILTNGDVWTVYDRNGIVLNNIVLSDEKHLFSREYDFFKMIYADTIARGEKLLASKSLMKMPDYGKPFMVVDFNSDSLINSRTDLVGSGLIESCPTKTFQRFVDLYLERIYELQKTNRFSVKIISEKESDIRNSCKASRKIDGHCLYITGDYSTLHKRVLLKQMIYEMGVDNMIVVDSDYYD